MSLGGSSFDGGNAGGDFDAPPAASLAHQLGPAIAAAEELYGMDSETAALVLAPTRPEEDAFAAVISGTGTRFRWSWRWSWVVVGGGRW